MPDPDQPSQEPVDQEVTSAVLEDEEGESYVIKQENLGPDALEGSGEWPSTEAPPQAPAPGSVGEAGSGGRQTGDAVADHHGGSSSTTGPTDGPTRNTDTDEGPAAGIHPPQNFKDAQDRDPVAGGSKSTPD